MTKTLIAGLIAASLLALSGCSQAATLTDSQKAEGFIDTKAGVAYKWTTGKPGEVECKGLGSCVSVEIVALKDCRSVYMEMNVLDSSGKAIDWTNATAGTLRVGERAGLSFHTMSDQADEGVFTKVLCS